MTDTSTPTPRLTAETNADGSVILKLAHPVNFEGRPVSRLTIPALTGKHLKLARWGWSDRVDMGRCAEWAAQIVEPQGIFDGLPIGVAQQVSGEVLLQLGKSLATGAEPSSASGG
jgi:hypothetical protein